MNPVYDVRELTLHWYGLTNRASKEIIKGVNGGCVGYKLSVYEGTYIFIREVEHYGSLSSRASCVLIKENGEVVGKQSLLTKQDYGLDTDDEMPLYIHAMKFVREVSPEFFDFDTPWFD